MTLHRKSYTCIPSILTILAIFAIALVAPAQDATSGHYLITNDNQNPNTATVFILGGTQTDPLLTDPVAVGTGGVGTGSPNDAAKTVITVNVGTTACAFVSNTGSGTVAGIRLPYTLPEPSQDPAPIRAWVASSRMEKRCMPHTMDP
jgi:hypothetical protein